MIDDYETQAQDFMEKHGVTMETKRLYHGPFLEGEMEELQEIA